MTTPLKRSMDYLRALGWYPEPVEQNVRIARDDADGKRDDLTFKRDLFGFADIIALKNNRVMLVQSTSAENVAARVAKIRASHTFDMAKKAGMIIVVHGWGAPSTKHYLGLRVVDLTNALTDWSSVFKAGPRRKNTPRKQTQFSFTMERTL